MFRFTVGELTTEVKVTGASMDRWEKARVVSAISATIAVPLVLGIVGYSVSRSVSANEVRGKFVEIAIEVLKQPSTDETEGIRQWSADIVDKYSGVSLDVPTKISLIQGKGISSVDDRY